MSTTSTGPSAPFSFSVYRSPVVVERNGSSFVRSSPCVFSFSPFFDLLQTLFWPVLEPISGFNWESPSVRSRCRLTPLLSFVHQSRRPLPPFETLGALLPPFLCELWRPSVSPSFRFLAGRLLSHEDHDGQRFDSFECIPRSASKMFPVFLAF